MTPLLGRMQRTARAAALAGLATVGMLLIGCGDNEGNDAKSSGRSASSSAADDLDGVKKIGPGRSLYIRCKGTGSPTVVMEAGDEDTSDSYAFAEPAVAKVARTCVYDRANLGRSGSAPGPRGLPALVSDLERLLKTAQISGPYVLVGTSGGGFITAGYASAHPRQIAGLVFVDTGATPEAPASRGRRRDSPGEPQQRRTPRLSASRKGRLGGPQADRRNPRHDPHRQVLRRRDQRVAVPVGAASDAAQRRTPAWLARTQPTREADRGPHRARGRGR